MMQMLVSRRAARALLILMLLLVPLGAWTAALPAAGGAQAEQVAAQALPGGEQVVQADRQPLSRAAVERRGDPGRARSVLLGVLVGAALLGVGWRWWGRGGRPIQRPRRDATSAYASRAPPGLLIV